MANPPAPDWSGSSEQPQKPGKTRSWRPHWRIFTWVIIAFNLLMLIWLIAGVSTAGDDDEACEGLTGEALETCRDAGDVGTAIGAGLIIVLWAAGAIILGVLWLVTGSWAKRRRGQ